MKSVVSVCEVSKLARIGNTQLNIPQVVDVSICIVDLIDHWLFGICNVHDDQPLLTAGDKGPVACDVKISCVVDWESCCEFGIGGVGDIKNLQAISVSDKAIAELKFDGARLVEHIRTEYVDDNRFFGVLNIDDDESGMAADPCIVTEDRD